MSYYQGDYYRGDYYRGDPGFLGNIGKALGKVGGAVLKASPVGTAISIAKTLLPARSQPPGLGPTIPDFGAPGPGTVPPGRVLISPFGPAGIPLRPGVGRGRVNASTYVTRGGGTSRWPRQLLVHPKGTENVPSRRMNVGNARALKKSIRRLKGFARLASSVMIAKRFKGGRKKKK